MLQTSHAQRYAQAGSDTSQARARRRVGAICSGEDWLRTLGHRVTVTQADCWVVGDDPDTYPQIKAFGEQHNAHRAVYALVHPDDDIDGMHVHHMCQVPACINPKHLVAMTPGDHRRWHLAHTAPVPTGRPT